MKEESDFGGNSEERSFNRPTVDEIVELDASVQAYSALSSKEATFQSSASSTTKEVLLKVNDESTADLRKQIGFILKEGGKESHNISTPNTQGSLVAEYKQGEEGKGKEERCAVPMEFEADGVPALLPTPAPKSCSVEDCKKLGEQR